MKRRGQETFIWSDWLKLKNKNKFDLIIGHQVFNMLPFEKQSLLAKVAAQNLTATGLFIHSTIIRTKKKFYALDGFKRHRRLIKKLKTLVPIFPCIHLDLLLAYGQRNGLYTPRGCRDLVDNLYQKGLIIKNEHNVILK